MNISEKIKKILAKTQEVGCTQQEAESALAMASRLMAQYNISMDEVKSSEEKWGIVRVATYGKWTLDMSLITKLVSDHCFVKYIAESVADRYNSLQFYGLKDNVINAKYMYDSLEKAFDKIWTSYKRRTNSPAKYRRIFISSMASGFDAKMRSERKKLSDEMNQQNNTPGKTEIVLANAMQKVEEKFKQQYPMVRFVKAKITKTNYNSQIAHDGYIAGRNLTLHESITKC